MMRLTSQNRYRDGEWNRFVSVAAEHVQSVNSTTDMLKKQTQLKNTTRYGGSSRRSLATLSNFKEPVK
ncbi:hypothetical protein ZIOFF_029104 [Zingiber officinale]|uniref:Uncharacterized protein n=1 Tax=Zingiber officinale TaxID=94328 RepID=A0A8J5GP06_ZINOF|nr:hypothetical protein ZIOFF_029104 [Zingiber officinale]